MDLYQPWTKGTVKNSVEALNKNSPNGNSYTAQMMMSLVTAIHLYQTNHTFDLYEIEHHFDISSIFKSNKHTNIVTKTQAGCQQQQKIRFVLHKIECIVCDITS